MPLIRDTLRDNRILDEVIVDCGNKSKELMNCITEKGHLRVQYIAPEDVVTANTTPENLKILNDWLY